MRAILERDFLSLVVRRRSFWARVAVASVVAAVILLVLEDNAYILERSPDRLARYLFLGGGAALLSLLALLTPPAVVGSILEERQRETLPLVLTTPVGPRGFALAKLLARAGTVLAWALAAVVPLAMVLTMGGVSGRQVLDLGILSLAVVFELAAWSLWISTVSRRSATATILAFLIPVVRWGIVVFLWAALVVPGGPFRNETRLGERGWVGWALGSTTPVAAIFRGAEPAEYARLLTRSFSLPGGAAGGPPPAASLPHRLLLHPSPLYLLFALGAAALSVLLAGRRLRTEGEPPPPGLFHRWRSARRRLRAPPGEGNPVAWKERRLLNTAASRPLYYTVFGLILGAEIAYLFAAATLDSDRDRGTVAVGMVAAYAPLLGLLSVVGGAAAIAHERATGTLDLVRVSLLGDGEYFRGKALGAFLGPAFLALLPAAHVGFALALGAVDGRTAAVAILQIALAVGLWGVVGLHCGLAAPRTGLAVTRAILIFGVMLIAVPLLAAVSGEIFRQRDFAEFLVAACPPATAWFTTEGSLRAFHPGWGRLFPYGGSRLGDEHRWAIAWTGFEIAGAVGGLLLARLRAGRLWETEREGPA